MPRRTYILIPAYNEATVLAQVIREVQSCGYKNILVVDDGSCDGTSEHAQKAGALVVRHALNRGKGAALKTGFKILEHLGPELVVLLDGDGQHNPQDIQKMISAIHAGYDVVLGTRADVLNAMPYHKILANYIGNLITYLVYGLWVRDSQSGMRAFSKRALSLISTKFDSYEFESEVIGQIKTHSLSYTEVPIETRYTSYSKNKMHGQSMYDGLRTIYKMIFFN